MPAAPSVRTAKKEMTFELRVVHVEHGIRGQESLADCEFVEKMCGEAWR